VNHWTFVIAAYALTGATLTGLAAAAWAAMRAAEKR
jgi:hypothetical protein